MQTLWQDLKFALRMLRKNPGFTAVAMLTLALGIGANTAIFSVVNAVLLRLLPYGGADQLLAISQTDRASGTTGVPVSFTKFTAILEQNKSLAGVGAFYGYSPSLVSEKEPELLNAVRVSADLLRVLGVRPLLGRSFLPEEEAPGGNDAAVLSDGFWHSHFAADPGMLGKTISLDGKRVTVVGVLPASFHFPLQFPEPDVWLPRVSESNFLTSQQIHSGAGYLSVIARLRPGETLSRTQAELAAIDGRYREQFGSYVD